MKIKNWPWIKILVGVILLTLFSLFITISVLKSRNATLIESAETYKNNLESYKGLYNQELSNNNILKMSEIDLKKSRDSLLNELGKFIEKNRKEKKITNPTSVGGISQEVKFIVKLDTIYKLDNYLDTVCANSETCITVEIKDSVPIVTPKITNSIRFEFGYNKVYLNEYKNGWKRFWHFDWKKVKSYEYVIENSNELIENKDVKIINLNDK